MTPGAERWRACYSDFTVNPASPISFESQLVSDPDVSAMIQRSEKDSIFNFRLLPNISGPICARRSCHAGNYVTEDLRIGTMQAMLPCLTGPSPVRVGAN